MIALLWSKFWRVIVGVALALAGIAAIFLKGRASGEAKQDTKVARAQQDAEVAKQSQQAVETRHDVETKVQELPQAPAQKVADADPSTAAGRLRDEWMR